MKTYRIKITFLGGSSQWIQANTKKLQKAGNVVNYVFSKCLGNIQRIAVRLWNENAKKYYTNVSYDSGLDILRERHSRVKVTYKWNESENMYIGRSTGWIPCYLVIKRKDSMSGGDLLVESIKNISVK